MSDLDRLTAELLQDPEFKREYELLGPRYEVISQVLSLRYDHNLTQGQLAEKMGKHQSAIARLESGSVSPSLSFLQELAQAFDLKLTIRFEPKKEEAQPELEQPKTGRRRKIPTEA